MVKNHMKRINMPKTWQIKRKKHVFVSRPKPGTHPMMQSMSINTIFKEVLKLAKTTKEVKDILNNSEILVDNKRRKDYRFSVGLMDVITIPKTNESFRIVLNKRGKLTVKEIKKVEANIKPKRIVDKTIVKKGRMQLNLFDGHSMIVDKGDYKVGDTVIYDFNEKKIKDVLKLDKGAVVYLTGGKHIGAFGKVEDISGRMITVKTDDNKTFETSKAYAFVVGKDKPVIEM